MADIIQIYGSEADKSLVLNPGESRSWTLDSPSYMRCRAVAIISMIKSSNLTHSDTVGTTKEGVLASTTTDFLKFFNFGFKYSAEGFPGTGGSSYFGYSSGFDTSFGDPTTQYLRNAEDGSGGGPRTMNFTNIWTYHEGVSENRQSSGTDYNLGYWQTNADRLGGAGSILMVELESSGTTFTLRAGTTQKYVFGSGEDIYSKSRVQTALTITPTFTVTYDHGGALSLPDQVFIYSPFLTYRLAIHAFGLQVIN